MTQARKDLELVAYRKVIRIFLCLGDMSFDSNYTQMIASKKKKIQ